ncbi:Syntaxin-124 [Apostasia shenzhenica]|uniref:Syntaxin-124 n=1 Tax=Apostasia shenzhenica TaxID=1088818 RepID=A0A2I0A5W8_9ASPA|nr:Syntaxin-124 [Apostasia shenzhenica]
MNDLFSTNSFKKYTDLKHQVQMDNIELGGPGATTSSDGSNLDKFFRDVESVKEDMKGLEQLYRRLQDLNEETKTAHSAKMMKNLRSRMDTDIEQVLRRAKVVKQKLEALDKSNASHRKLPGCGPGSSADRTRTGVVAGLGKKLKDLMDDFQGLRGRIAAEYKETVGRRYYTVTGERPDEETIETLILTGESESFLQKAIREQGRGQIMDAISEIQERHDAVKEIEKSLMDLHQVFLDMAALVEAQGQQLNDIESHVAHASSFVKRGAVELEVAKEYQRSSRKWYCIAFLLGTVLIVVLLMPILTTVIRPA